jgi:endonuclease/exonuclease/phosphatase family metal-dependent hydrolase
MPSNSQSDRRRFLSSSVTLFLSLVAFLVLPVCTASAADTDNAKNDLLVMTFNIRYGTANDGPDRWDNRKDQVCDVIERYHCDVVGLQEALRFQIDAIREALPVYDEIGVGRDDGKTKGEYSAILYRKDRLELIDSGTFWLSDTPEVVGSTSWGNSITRICTWGRFLHKPSGKTFYHFNLHMDHQSQPSREKSAVLVAQRIADRKHPDPVVLTGDFNASEYNKAIRYLKGDLDLDGKTPVPLVDTFRVLHPEAMQVGTFNGFRGVHSGDKIDYIFVEPGTKVLEARIIHDNEDGHYPSDHFPVMARLSLAAPESSQAN